MKPSNLEVRWVCKALIWMANRYNFLPQFEPDWVWRAIRDADRIGNMSDAQMDSKNAENVMLMCEHDAVMNYLMNIEGHSISSASDYYAEWRRDNKNRVVNDPHAGKCKCPTCAIERGNRRPSDE